MYVARIYRPSNKPVTDFTQFFSGAMEHTNRFHTVLAGDFNIDVRKNSFATRNYINTFHQYSFVNENNLPSFILPRKRSAISSIDHVWHSLNVPRSSYVVSLAPSDHYAVCVIFKIKHDSPPKTNCFRDFNDVNKERFAENIDDEFLLCSPPVSNPK